MNAGDYRTTAILTEHFGLPPLKLIDDVINAVNHILNNCIQGLESYLQERRAEIDSSKSASKQITSDEYQKEIESGIAKLETLLDAQIDKNFDKFELYAFRNIFTIPKDLIEEGWVRLKHQESIDFSKLPELNNRKKELDQQIKKLIHEINLELKLRKILKLQLIKAEKIITTLNNFRSLINSSLFNEENPDLKKLLPLKDNLYFILTQVDDLINQMQLINDKFLHNDNLNNINNLKFVPSIRDKYILSKSLKILETVGALDEDPATEQTNHRTIVPPVTQASASEIENIKHFNKQLQSNV